MADLRISIPTLDVLKNTRTDELEKALTHVFNNNSKWAFSFILYWMKDRIEQHDENVDINYLYGFWLDMEPVWNDECMIESTEEKDIYVEEIPDIPNKTTNSIKYNIINKKQAEKDYSDDDEY